MFQFFIICQYIKQISLHMSISIFNLQYFALVPLRIQRPAPPPPSFKRPSSVADRLSPPRTPPTLPRTPLCTPFATPSLTSSLPQQLSPTAKRKVMELAEAIVNLDSAASSCGGEEDGQKEEIGMRSMEEGRKE